MNQPRPRCEAPAPLPVELLATDDQRRLSDAIGSSMPLAASLAEECARDIRKVSVADHQRFRESIAPQPQFDEIDEAAGDPIHDHRPQSAPRHKVNRVLGILDKLDSQNPNRRFAP